MYAGKYSTASKRFALPKRVDLIMKATHGATPDRLANGSVATAKYIAGLRRDYPHAELCFSTYSGNPAGAQEETLTKKILPGATHVGAIPNTSKEARALKQKCDEMGVNPKTMVILTDEFNSWRTRDIYRLYFRETDIFIVAIPISQTFDPESSIDNFRNMNKAIVMETLVPLVPFWIMTHTGEPGKWLLEWVSDRISQAPASS